MTLREFAGYARKAVGVLAVSESAAVTAGLISGPAVGIAGALVGVANAAVAFLVSNRPPARDQ